MNQSARDLPSGHNLYATKTFNGREVLIPEGVDETSTRTSTSTPTSR